MKCFIIQYFLFNYIMESSNLQTSWINYDPAVESFPIQNIPFGIYENTESGSAHCCTRIGEYVIDLAVLASHNLFGNTLDKSVFKSSTLNNFIDLGRPVWKTVRARIQEIFSKGSQFENDDNVKSSLIHFSKAVMKLPVKIGDYTDFYSSRNHAFNMGKIIRGEKDALQPNWVHLPVGYHGRSSTIVVDGTKIKRPRGQIKPPKAENPLFSETKRLDYEVEVGVVIGKSNEMGSPVPIRETEDYIFGLVLLNDWSARDVQTWEYIPLGPFNAKNFASTISPWIVTLEALEPFKVELPKQDPTPLKYLYDENLYSWDIPINVSMKTKNQTEENIISTTNYKYMYWTVKQQIAHHTVTGCKLNVGDVLGSGTISGTDPSSYGCLFEMNQGGSKIIQVGNEERTWIEDGDYVNLNAEIKGNGYKIGFGNCGGEILPANPEEMYY
jgi:fumarylacetoacetase